MPRDDQLITWKTMTEIKHIIEWALGEFMDAVRIRRHLHAYPELSFKEFGTADFIAGELEKAGIPFVRVAGTGILARIEGKAGGSGRKAVVLRADIDALPVAEANNSLDYRSAHDGVMHACGHDMHAAILFGALSILNSRREKFSGVVLGLFQPGEELNPGGASKVLAENVFDGYDIKAFIGEHVEPELPTGTFGFRAGKYMASNDELRFTVRGRGGHAALRKNIIDPVEASASLIGKLYAVPTLNTDGSMPAILSIGRVEANGATNVVPDEVYMEGTMRAFDEQLRVRMKEAVGQAARETDAEFGVKTDVDISAGYPCVCNDERLTAVARSAAVKMFGNGNVVNLSVRSTSEDFGFYTQRYPSVFYRIGVGGEGDYFGNARAGRLHTPGFCPDEKSMGFGMALFVALVFEIMGDGVKV